MLRTALLEGCAERETNMITPKFLLFLAIGTLAMLCPLLICGTWYKMRLYKCVIVAFLLTVVGSAGTYLLGFIENQYRFGSRSFYGAVFLIPIVFLFVAKLLRITYVQLMDISAPAVCIMLVLMKVLCFMDGCCAGRILFVTASGVAVSFPSQIAEMANALIISVALMLLAYKKPKRGDIFPLYMVIYGATRFILNLFRENQTDFLFGMAPGNVWSMLSIIIGIAWLFIVHQKPSPKGKAVPVQESIH